MYNKQHSTALWIVIALLGCGLALIALAGQVVSAQSVEPELSPPFRFEERPAALEAQPAGPGSTVLMTQTFGASFAPVTDLNGSTPQWRIIRNPGDTAGYFWDKVGAGTPTTFSNSAWSAARLYTATQILTPGVSPYPAGQDAWLIYGPVDLSKLLYAHLSFEYYLDSQAGDTLLWGYSTDGQTFYGNSQSGPLGTWITDTFSFRTNATFHTAYLAFAFNSHADPQGRKGDFVRNVILTGEPLILGYLPIVTNNYAVPTPTPLPPLYGYTFDPNSNDLNLWGGTITGNPRQGYGGPCVEGQFARTNHGNPVNSLALWNNCKFVPTYSSPNVDAPANFEMIVDMSPWRLYGEDLYGVIFNYSNVNNLYRLSLATNEGNNVVTSILLERCSGGSCTPLTSGYAGLQPLPPGLVIYAQSAFWDQMRVLRVGNNIKVFVNGVQVVNVNDSNPLTGLKFGVHVFPLAGNITEPPEGAQMQIDFDNIRVYAR